MAAGSTGDINGYLLLDFFSSEVNSTLFGTVGFAITAAYIAFIIYLVSWGVKFRSWCNLGQPKVVADTEI